MDVTTEFEADVLLGLRRSLKRVRKLPRLLYSLSKLIPESSVSCLLEARSRPKKSAALLSPADKFGKLEPNVVPQNQSIANLGHDAYIPVLGDDEADAAGKICAVPHH